MKIKLTLLIILSTLLTSMGCASHSYYSVQVDAISAPEAAKHKHYWLMPANKETDPGDLQFKEFANYVDGALKSLGYFAAQNAVSADTIIFIGYGVGEPQVHQALYSMPVWGQTGIRTARTTATINTSGDTETYIEYRPTYGVTGSEMRADTYVSYRRYLFLDAVAAKAWQQNNKQQLWKTTVVSYGRSNDLRIILPIMVAAARPYFGMDSGKKIHLQFDDQDPRALPYLKNHNR